MASLVQSVESSSPANQVTFPQEITAGNLLLVTWVSSSDVVVADSLANAWSVAYDVPDQSGSFRSGMAYCFSRSSGPEQINVSANAYLIVTEWSGVNKVRQVLDPIVSVGTDAVMPPFPVTPGDLVLSAVGQFTGGDNTTVAGAALVGQIPVLSLANGNGDFTLGNGLGYVLGVVVFYYDQNWYSLSGNIGPIQLVVTCEGQTFSSVITDPYGVFNFMGLSPGWYKVAPVPGANQSFVPAYQQIYLTGDVAGVNFTLVVAFRVRKCVDDFIHDVAARSKPGGDQYRAVVNKGRKDKDSLRILKNGEVLFRKIEYRGSGQAKTDANPMGDAVVVHNLETNAAACHADAQSFLNGLGGDFVPKRPVKDW
jgi:hypothetical protein